MEAASPLPERGAGARGPRLGWMDRCRVRAAREARLCHSAKKGPVSFPLAPSSACPTHRVDRSAHLQAAGLDMATWLPPPVIMLQVTSGNGGS